jgi:predicted  nucleic acid-binding Zn-ribbon protein
VENANVFEKGISAIRLEFAHVLGSVKELGEEFLRLNMHRQGEQSVLAQEMQSATLALQELRSKNKDLHEEITQLHVELSRSQLSKHAVGPEWNELSQDLDDEIGTIQNQLLHIFDPVIQSDPYVQEKSKKLKDVSYFVPSSEEESSKTPLFTPERFKIQLRFIRSFLQAAAIHATGLLRRQQSEAESSPKISRKDTDEPLITHSELQRSLNAANVIIQRLKSALQEASNENDRNKHYMDSHKKELKKLKDSYVQLKQILKEKEEEVLRMRKLLFQKEEEMQDLFEEKASISHIVIQACNELEKAVVE